MTLKTKLKSIYRRYKKYPSVWCILMNLVCIAIPPYSIVGTILSLMFAGIFVLVLHSEREADVARRVSKLIAHKTITRFDVLTERLYPFERAEHRRKLYSSYRFSASDEFYYDGAWRKVASVNFQEDLIAYDISTDEDDDLQLVWLRFESIESYKPHYEETNANT